MAASSRSTDSNTAIASKSASERQKREGIFDGTVKIPPGKSISYVNVRLTIGAYCFEVADADGPVLMAAGELDGGESHEIAPAEIERAMGSAIKVEPGHGKTLSGELHRGRFLWIVANPSEDKPVLVTIRFTS